MHDPPPPPAPLSAVVPKRLLLTPSPAIQPSGTPNQQTRAFGKLEDTRGKRESLAGKSKAAWTDKQGETPSAIIQLPHETDTSPYTHKGCAFRSRRAQARAKKNKSNCHACMTHTQNTRQKTRERKQRDFEGKRTRKNDTTFLHRCECRTLFTPLQLQNLRQKEEKQMREKMEGSKKKKIKRTTTRTCRSPPPTVSWRGKPTPYCSRSPCCCPRSPLPPSP